MTRTHSATNGSHARVRYLVDGAFDPRYADGGVSNFEVLEYVAAGGGWHMLTLDRQLTLGPGTLYAALSRLESRGLIEALTPQDRRRPYRITAAGAAALRTYLEHTRVVAKRGLRRLAACA